MSSKRSVIRATLAVVSAAVLIASASVAFASGGSRQAPVTMPTLTLTYNGVPVEIFVPGSSTTVAVNDIHLVSANPTGCAAASPFHRFCRNGPITEATSIPSPAVSTCRHWHRAGSMTSRPDGDPNYNFTYAYWSLNGVAKAKLVPPPSANDFELYSLKGGLLKSALDPQRQEDRHDPVEDRRQGQRRPFRVAVTFLPTAPPDRSDRGGNGGAWPADDTTAGSGLSRWLQLVSPDGGGRGGSGHDAGQRRRARR